VRLHFSLAEKSTDIFSAFVENGNVALKVENPHGFNLFRMRLAG
jgi:hypothetical protein